MKGTLLFKKLTGTLALASAAALVLAGCAGGTAETASTTESTDSGTSEAVAGGLIGVSMPTQSSTRWISDGENIKELMEAEGFDVDLQFAEDDIPTQVAQLEAMLTKGAKALIIAAIDGTQLTDVLQAAADAGVPVIAYDRLIRDSANVDYYATFDNFQVGVQQATSLLVGMGVYASEDSTSADGANAAGPWNVELFAGSPDDNNATFFFNGAMSVLQPLIDSGVLVVGSGQTDFEQVAILRWDGATAQKRMEDILVGSYAGDTVHGVLSPYDGLSRGIIAALVDGGYTSETLPVITGQDAEVLSVKSMLAGEQYSTIFKDTRELAGVASSMAIAILNGEEPEVTDTTTYDNGVKVVPSYLLTPYIVTVDNYEALLIDSGYIAEADLG
ncbi:MAG TPA: sugar ABC transporter substrate-binding protein [Actinobacteria bacterium]|nr:sugar ABC transporter substrate-binding protein [Actinomycetota bacterium]